MRTYLNKIIATIIVCFLMVSFVGFPVAALGEPSRMINIVYDDSGSMYTTEGQEVDTWCQAKYAMEVFVSMMGDNDTINIYYMSDFDNGSMAAPRLSLYGRDGALSNVSAVHNERTTAGNTPFNSVRKAYSDLNESTADQRWLVVLTDGAFEDGAISESEVNSFFASKADYISVCFLAIGDSASVINDSPDSNIYSYHAVTNQDILHNVTSISSRVFERNRLDVNVDTSSVSFDVPMQELIVFAQGADVTINGIRTEDGTLIQSTEAPVTVSYSECDADNKSNSPTTDLRGSIATFRTDFSIGAYTIDVSGAETLEVYYKPNVEVAVSLIDSEGNPITMGETVEEGDYTLVLNLADPVTHDVVNSSSDLLGDIDFTASVTNNGVSDGLLYTDGDVVHIEEGSVYIVANAHYLDYNYLTTEHDFSAISNKELTFTVIEDPTFNIISEGIETEATIVVHAQVDGREFTASEWEALDTPTVSYDFFVSMTGVFDPGDLIIEKTDEIGNFIIYPTLNGEKPSSGTYSDRPYTISYSQEFGEATWTGMMQNSVKFTDSRSWIERNWILFVRLLIIGIILFIIAGYLPCFKFYLPRSLKARPNITCQPMSIGQKKKSLPGEVKKNIGSTLIPYVPQTGSIRYVPKGTSATMIRVRGTKEKNVMVITNTKAFAGKPEFKINMQSIEKNFKGNKNMHAGSRIDYEKKGYRYTCYPNQK